MRRSRRLDPGARPRARRARTRSRSRFSTRRSCRSRGQRSAVGAAWSRSTSTRMLLLRGAAPRSVRSPAAWCSTTVGRRRRRVRAQSASAPARVERALAHVQALRRAGGPDPVAAAAAGAVQDLRPAGRRRGHQRRGDSPTAIAIGRGIRYFGEGLLAVWYGDQAMDVPRRQRADGRPRFWSALAGRRRSCAYWSSADGRRRNACIIYAAILTRQRLHCHDRPDRRHSRSATRRRPSRSSTAS